MRRKKTKKSPNKSTLQSVKARRIIHQFGLMDFTRLARLVIPSATGMTIGVQVVLFSFFFSTLQLSVRDLWTERGAEEAGRAGGSAAQLSSPAWLLPSESEH